MPRSLLAAFVVAVTLASTSVAFGDNCSSPSPSDAPPVLRIVNGRRVWIIPPTCIPGERQAPYVFTLPGRSSLGYTPTQTTRSDAARVVDAVRHAPF